MGSGGMKRKGRRHLPKISGEASGTLGFQHSAWTPPGQIERARGFAQGLMTESRRSRREFRVFGVVFLGIVVLFVLVGFVTQGFPS
jgi:hypothetical protein